MINIIFRKLLILNQFFDFYFLNMDISLVICFPNMNIFVQLVNLGGSTSQNFDLAFSFYVTWYVKKRVTFGIFLILFFSR